MMPNLYMASEVKWAHRERAVINVVQRLTRRRGG
jgi:hypothetical protein